MPDPNPIGVPLGTLPTLKNTSVEELQEQAEEVDYLKPREFGKLIGVLPQQVYQWIRKGIINSYTCTCGSTLVCVSEAKRTLEARKVARGESIDTRPDQED